MRKLSLITILMVAAYTSFSQDKPIVRYYDSSWLYTPAEKAVYRSEYFKKINEYEGIYYRERDNSIYSKSLYSDTSSTVPVGFRVKYSEDGIKIDSTAYYEFSLLKEAYSFYPNGMVQGHYSYDKNSKTIVQEGFDENGAVIPNFTYLREADFKQGTEGWKAYLAKSINSKVPTKNGAPAGTYTVIVQFIVEEDGSLSNILAGTKIGYGMEEELVRVIKKSPKWAPAILLGKNVKAYRRQPITFVVEDRKKK